MGKKSAISSLSKIIANTTVHKILLKYTNKPESISHLHHEVLEYRDTAIFKTEEFNWNESDKEKIKSDALKRIKRKMAGKYSDVKFPMEDAKKLLDETMREIGF